MEYPIELFKQQMDIMNNKNILISIYTNASGFLWNLMMVDSGTDLGWSDFNGDCENSGTFTTYNKALEDAITLINKCSLEQFRQQTPNNKFHWGNYADHLNKNYR